jgi:hypothetical protein
VPWNFIFISLSYAVRASKITQTLLIPDAFASEPVASISVLGVASDGSGMTTFLYFEPDPVENTMFIG